MTKISQSTGDPKQPAVFGPTPAAGKLQTLAVMLIVGSVFTVAVLVMLGHFAEPDSVAADNAAVVSDPFADTEDPVPAAGGLDEETCQVMSTAIKDINARMSEGVTEQQARYFRSRRNKLYQMMRDRCGV